MRCGPGSPSGCRPWLAVDTLYVVGAPLGDPEDLTLRARRILAEAGVIVADDLPTARHLLDHWGILTPLIPLSESGEGGASGSGLKALEAGTVALLSPSWSPGPGDMGQQLIRAAIGRGLAVVPIPGPTLPISALLISGLPTDSFLYLGWLPQAACARRDLLTSVASEQRSLVALESPGRLRAALVDLGQVLGDRPLAVVAGAAQQPDEIWRGTTAEASERPPDLPARGPCVLVVGGARERTARWDKEQLQTEIQAHRAQGLSIKEISRQLALESGWSRREVYDLALDVTRRASGH